MAASRAGAIPVPVNPQLTKSEFDHVVKNSDAKLVVRAATEVDGHDPLATEAAVDPGSVAALFYTSGTTGKPKGVELSHRSLVGSLARAGAVPPVLTGRYEAVTALPVAHIMGFAVLLGLACTGIPVYLLPRFNPVRVLDAIENRRAQMFIGVPAMYRMLLEAGAEDRDLTSIRVWGSGADAMPPELAGRFKKLGATVTLPIVGPIGEAAFFEGYGMVELGGGAAAKFSPPFLDVGLGSDAVGFPLPGYSFQVVDPDTGERLPAGRTGELLIRGRGVTSGYWGDAGATAATVSEDGLAPHRRPRPSRTVRHGAVRRTAPRTCSRSAATPSTPSRSSGRSRSTPTSSRSPSSGWPTSAAGSSRRRSSVSREGVDLDPDALHAFAAERLAAYKVPVRWHAVEELPRTGTNKVKKTELAALFD